MAAALRLSCLPPPASLARLQPNCLQDLGPLLRLETPTANWGYYRC